MIGSGKLLAIIPARGNSKRLPGKNTKNLLGKPLISWTINAALKSKYIDRVVVSTDDDEIANDNKFIDLLHKDLLYVTNIISDTHYAADSSDKEKVMKPKEIK